MNIKKRNKGWKDEEGEECNSWSDFFGLPLYKKSAFFLLVYSARLTLTVVVRTPDVDLSLVSDKGCVNVPKNKTKKTVCLLICKRSSRDKLGERKGLLVINRFMEKDIFSQNSEESGTICQIKVSSFLKPQWRYDLCFGDVE